MSKFSGNPLFEGHLDLPEQAKACDRSERTIIRWTELAVDPLPYIELPNGEKIFNIETSKKWLARRERSALLPGRAWTLGGSTSTATPSA
jgi:hypothetical protein